MAKNIRTISAHSRTVVLASIILIGAAACYNWFVSPHTNYLRAAQRYESAAEDLASRNRVMKTMVAAKRKELARLRGEFDRARQCVFDVAGAKEFFNGIEAAAQKAGCEVSSLNFPSTNSKAGSDRRSGYLSARLARLSVQGGYPGIVALMAQLQNRRERVLIDSIDIESSGNRNAPAGQLDCQMNVTIYVMQDEEASIHE